MRKLLGWLFVGAFAVASRGATNITADVTLDADADWRTAGVVTVAAGVTVDLNGHILKIAGLAGEGRITASATRPVAVPEVITAQAMFWLDAADTSTLTIDASNNVTAWRSKVGEHVEATLQDPDVAPLYSATGFQLPCVDFGTCGSKKSLSYKRFENIRTAFAVMKLQKSCNVAFLTDRKVFDFYRGQNGQYLHSSFSKDNAQHVWNGISEVNPSVDVIPDDSFQVLCYEMSIEAHSDTLAMDRPELAKTNSLQAPFNGGKQISELILFDSILSETDRLAVTEYLQKKWGFVHVPGNEVHLDISGTAAADYNVQSIAVDEGVTMVLDDAKMGAACNLCGLGTIRVDGVVDMNGHELHVGGLSGQGTITSLHSPLDVIEPLSAPAIVRSSMFWLDAADKSTLTVDADGKVSAWRSKVGTRVATLRDTDVAPTYSETGFALPCVDCGINGSKQSLSYDRFSNIRTVFAVMKLQKIVHVALLTDRVTHDFFRGDNGTYLHHLHSSKNASHVWNGTQEVSFENDVIPDNDFQVLCYEMAIDAHSDTLAMDRPGTDAQAPYNGGKQISELILFDSVLSEADRLAVTTYLKEKWGAYRTAGTPLHVNVPEGQTMDNTVALQGRLKLVKEGGGTYNAVRQEQTYLGGTVVAAGTATVPQSGATDNTHALGHHQYGPSGSKVVVESGATFDTKGNYDSYACDFVLNGGALANTGCNQQYYNKQWACGGSMTLTTNSQYLVNYWTAYTGGPIDLGGHELEVVSSSSNGILIFYNVAPANGVIKTRGDTYLQFESSAALDMRTVDLVLGTAICVMDAEINVRNLTTVDYTGAGASAPAGRQRHVNIHGVYKPLTDYAHYFALQDGATIDLSARTTELDLTNKSFDFAPGAEIRVKLGNRRVSSKDPLIKWNGKPENVKFLPVRNESGWFEPREDGLYRFGGVVIFIR